MSALCLACDRRRERRPRMKDNPSSQTNLRQGVPLKGSLHYGLIPGSRNTVVPGNPERIFVRCCGIRPKACLARWTLRAPASLVRKACRCRPSVLLLLQRTIVWSGVVRGRPQNQEDFTAGKTTAHFPTLKNQKARRSFRSIRACEPWPFGLSLGSIHLRLGGLPRGCCNHYSNPVQ